MALPASLQMSSVCFGRLLPSGKMEPGRRAIRPVKKVTSTSRFGSGLIGVLEEFWWKRHRIPWTLYTECYNALLHIGVIPASVYTCPRRGECEHCAGFIKLWQFQLQILYYKPCDFEKKTWFIWRCFWALAKLEVGDSFQWELECCHVQLQNKICKEWFLGLMRSTHHADFRVEFLKVQFSLLPSNG